MTYCIGIKLDSGIIVASDSRTSAGVDYISVFSKTHRFSVEGEREIFLLNAGNLGTTQEVVSVLRREIQKGVEGNLLELESLFDVAGKVGDTVCKVMQRLRNNGNNGVDFSCSFLVGGQIRGEGQRLFKVYSEGNFIEATKETSFFQIGESKYGKPILDRVIEYTTNVPDAIKCALVSFDSTMRSNLSVGLPINLHYLPKSLVGASAEESAEIKEPLGALLDENHAELRKLREHWRSGLQNVFANIPNYNWWQQYEHSSHSDDEH